MVDLWLERAQVEKVALSILCSLLPSVMLERVVTLRKICTQLMS
jgi:hypothetical protein